MKGIIKDAKIRMDGDGYTVTKINGDRVSSRYRRPTRDTLEDDKVELKKEGYEIYELRAEITVSGDTFDTLENKPDGGWQDGRELSLSYLDRFIKESKEQGYRVFVTKEV